MPVEIDLECSMKETVTPLEKNHDCIDAIVCTNPTNSCFLGECEVYPGTTLFKDMLIRAFNEYRIDELKSETCLKTDRCRLKLLCCRLMNS